LFYQDIIVSYKKIFGTTIKGLRIDNSLPFFEFGLISITNSK